MPEYVSVDNAASLSHAWLGQQLADNPYPADRYAGRGIVIAAGGPKYSTCAYVAVRALRHVGCRLPIEIWYRGIGEYLAPLEAITEPLGCRWVDAYEVRKQFPHRRLNGFELKPYAIQHSSFEEVMFLDADNVVCRDPTYLFECQEYRDAGTCLWPDYNKLAPTRHAWQYFGVGYRDEWEVESGQVVIDKRRAWAALLLCHWYGERSEITWKHVYGDKELFHLCWRAIGQPYAMPSRHIHTLTTPQGQHSTMCQHDFQGRRLFQHRNGTKWHYWVARNPRVPGFHLEDECLDWLADLRAAWSPAAQTVASESDRSAAAALVGRKYLYERIGYGSPRPLIFSGDGGFRAGGAGCEAYWAIRGERLLIAGEDHGLTMDLAPDGRGGWSGRWLVHEKMPVKIVPAT